MNTMKIVEDKIPDLLREQKDRVVIAHLYKELFPSVKRFVKKNNGIEDDAYDAFQEAIIYFYNLVMKGGFDSKYKVYGFVYRVAVNRWLNKLSKEKRMVYDDDLTIRESSNEVFHIEEPVHKSDEEKNVLTKLVSHIGEKCVEVLTYRIYGNLMFEDVALRMDFSSEAAAKMHFKRCREKMVEIVKNNPVLADQIRSHVG